jgi:enoyl-CoA hydratase
MIDLEYDDGIATLFLNRPPVNAIDLAFLERAEAALAEIAARQDVAALIVTGRGRAFSAGLDLKAVPAYGAADQRRTMQGINKMVGRLYALSLPTVAAINGHAIAGGLVLALACDYRVGTSAPCQIGLTEARAGIPFPRAAMAVVRSELSPAVARRLTLHARNYGPQAALADGIVDELQPPEQVFSRAHALARELGAVPRVAYGRIKRQLRGTVLDDLADAIATGADPMFDSWLSPETAGAAAALLKDGKG